MQNFQSGVHFWEPVHDGINQAVRYANEVEDYDTFVKSCKMRLDAFGATDLCEDPD